MRKQQQQQQNKTRVHFQKCDKLMVNVIIVYNNTYPTLSQVEGARCLCVFFSAFWNI